MHPEILNKLRHEILGRVGPTNKPTYDDIREMKYLRAVINGKNAIYFLFYLLLTLLILRNTKTIPTCVSIFRVFRQVYMVTNYYYYSVLLMSVSRSIRQPLLIQREENRGMYRRVQGKVLVVRLFQTISLMYVHRVTYSALIMHRRTDLWGPDGSALHLSHASHELIEICDDKAQEFDPDRFLDYRLHKYLTPNPFIFLPFNAGPRICLGQQVRGFQSSDI